MQEPGAVRPGALNQNYLDAEKDKPRNRSRVRMRVRNRNTRALPLAANLVDPGEHVILCYDDEVAAVVAQIEDPQKILTAQEQFKNDLAEEVGKQVDSWQGTPEQMRVLIESRSDARVNEVYDRVWQTTGLSMERTFQSLFKRSMRPLVSASLVENSEHPEPQRANTEREVQKQADAFAIALDRVLTKHLSGANAMTPESIKALVKEQLEAELGGKAGASAKR